MTSSDRTVWVLSAVIEGTRDDAAAALEAIERTLCPDPDHDGYCPVPWTTMACRFDDLDDEERADWQQSFDEDRLRAREAGEHGTE